MIACGLLCFTAGVGVTLLWHWWVFARYDEWIVDNGGRLPPPGTE